MIRCLYRPDRDTRPADYGIPQGGSRDAVSAREVIEQHLYAVLPPPIHGAPIDHQRRVERELDTMTQADRVQYEIDRQGRATQMHSVDYDPLRGLSE